MEKRRRLEARSEGVRLGGAYLELYGCGCSKFLICMRRVVHHTSSKPLAENLCHKLDERPLALSQIRCRDQNSAKSGRAFLQTRAVAIDTAFELVLGGQTKRSRSWVDDCGIPPGHSILNSNLVNVNSTTAELLTIEKCCGLATSHGYTTCRMRRKRNTAAQDAAQAFDVYSTGLQG